MKSKKYNNIDVHYLMKLLENKNNSYEEIVEVLLEKLHTLKINTLLEKCNKEKNPLLKELLEIVIARKFLNCFIRNDYEEFPNMIKQYLNNVSSLDALCLLIKNKNKDVEIIARRRYEELFDAYLEIFENENIEDSKILYKTEGDDTQIILEAIKSDKIIPFVKKR